MGDQVEEVKVGETVTIYCNGCCTEYLVQHEPAYVGPKARQFGGIPKAPKHCPFCGEAWDLEVRE